MTTRVMLAAVLAFVPMLAEAAWSRRNERRLLRRGAVEASGDVMTAMAIAYPGAFVVMTVEGWWRALPFDGWAIAGLACWSAAKVVKYGAMAALGERWSFRVLVLPGAPLVRSGPYRWFRHPNYVGVVGELVGTALMCPAPLTGPLVTLGFGWLLRRRIAVEERALGLAS